ncbi:phenylalanine-4-hydroxylase [Acrasis kona]|uniref:phenylalanine 4-monooxygenase n=1 Tax=Acrasis kona TaxID=1008807 RepID=A0AAW2ZPM5_9EUKA
MSASRTLLLTIPHRVGALQKALDVLGRNNINIERIESRPSKLDKRIYDFVVDVKDVPEHTLNKCIDVLKETKAAESITFLGVKDEIPWFPGKISDLDKLKQEILEAGADLSSDHPGFNDQEYRNRRKQIAQIGLNYKHGDKIERVKYTKEETMAWGVIFNKLTSMYSKHACKEVNYVMPMLKNNCGYSENHIPQLQDIHEFLQDTTGFRIRPAAGLLTSRDFLNGLAFRVFHSTQYIRHHSQPLYTPEPDVVHELMGHVPLFADPDFAEFSQEIGLASLGASDRDISRLATLYWFTVEFGVCRQDGVRKAYGAGLLSSFGELEHSMSDVPDIKPFEPDKVCEQTYPITSFQPLYFEAESFERAKEQVKNWAAHMDRPFAVRYNPYTNSVEVLNHSYRLIPVARDLCSKMEQLKNSMEKIIKLQESS